MFSLISAMAIGLENIALALSQEELSEWDQNAVLVVEVIFFLGISLYLGIRGGKLTARHYVEEGYECITKDDALLARARTKWGLEL